MGFYGNITNTSNTTFQFDRIYPNRLAMDANANNDGIFIGVSADGFCYSIAQCIVKARAEKGASGVYHELIVAVADGSRLCGAEKIDVALLGEVEAVVLRTNEGMPLLLKGRFTDRTYKEIHGDILF